MAASQPEDATALPQVWNRNDLEAQEKLFSLLYDDLRQIAKQHLGKEARWGHSLQPAALVHETYLRLVHGCRVQWHDRDHFFAIAATTMHRILVEHARRRGAAKRDGGKPKLPLVEAARLTIERADLVALDDCLAALAKIDPLKASIVELRFFGGLSVEETARVVGCSRATVIRKWRLTKAWLRLELSEVE